MSPTLWLPLVWIMYCGSRAIIYWLYPETFVTESSLDYTSGNAVDRTFLMILMAGGIWVLRDRKSLLQKIFVNNKWLFALVLYLGISVIWSNFIDVSFKRYVRVIGDIIMMLIVATEPEPLLAFRRLLLRCSFVLIPMSVLLVKYFQGLGVSYNALSGTTMWIGVTTHKNQLGQLSCVCALNTLWNIMCKWRQRDLSFYNMVIIFLMSLWLLRGPAISTSKTSVFVFLFTSIVLMISSFFKKNPKYLVWCILSVGFSFAFLEVMSQVLFSESFADLVVAYSGRDMSLTGRTFLWEELLRIAALHPILGVGFGGFWIGNQHGLWEKFPWIPESAHNGFLDVYLDVGLIGVILLCGVIISSYQNIARTLISDFEFVRIRLTLFLAAIVYNFTESSFTKPTNFIWFIFLLCVVVDRDSVTMKEFRTDKVGYP